MQGSERKKSTPMVYNKCEAFDYDLDGKNQAYSYKKKILDFRVEKKFLSA